ncbi:MAG: hypothetical protein ACI4EA_07525 [Candidatus Ornithomonoglobus sp.]
MKYKSSVKYRILKTLLSLETDTTGSIINFQSVLNNFSFISEVELYRYLYILQKSDAVSIDYADNDNSVTGLTIHSYAYELCEEIHNSHIYKTGTVIISIASVVCAIIQVILSLYTIAITH